MKTGISQKVAIKSVPLESHIRKVRGARRAANRLAVRQHDGDCALCSGQVGGFVSTLRKHQTMGVTGHSLLVPEKDPHRLAAARWRLRFVVGASQGLRTNT
jgi:hypothetical protein